MCLQLFMELDITMVAGCTVLFLFGSYKMLNALIKDIKSDLRFTNQIAKRAKTAKNQAIIFKQLTKFVEFHTNLRQLCHFNY